MKVDEPKTFLDILIAAMNDAVIEGKITQIQTTITPEGTTKAKLLRIIVVPEEMEYVRQVGGKFGKTT